jgi:CRISPR-associated protein Csx17
LGSAATAYPKEKRGPIDSVRHHWLPLTDDSRRFNTKDKRLAHDVRVVAHGRDPEADLLSLLERRSLESSQKGSRHPRITAAPGLSAGLPDLAAWIAGDLDIARCVDLARAFMAVDWFRWLPRQIAIDRPSTSDCPDDAWCVLRLNSLAWPLDGDCDIPLDPAIVRRLASGDLEEAVTLSLRRLVAHGIRPTVRFSIGDSRLAQRWASALAFPISSATALRLRNQVHPQPKENHHDR